MRYAIDADRGGLIIGRACWIHAGVAHQYEFREATAAAAGVDAGESELQVYVAEVRLPRGNRPGIGDWPRAAGVGGASELQRKQVYDTRAAWCYYCVIVL